LLETLSVDKSCWL